MRSAVTRAARLALMQWVSTSRLASSAGSSEYVRELIRKDQDRLQRATCCCIDVWRVLHGQRDIPAWMPEPDAE